MEKTLRIELKPLEPYFLGNDRTFHYGEKDIERIGKTDYFIKSEKIPLQTSIFGTLRFLGIKSQKQDYSLDQVDIDNIGEESFQYCKTDQKFGRIKCISPLFLCNDENYYLPVPLDHKGGESYKPFSEYEMINTSYGERLLPLDYDAKEYDTTGFINVETNEVIKADAVFYGYVKTGINVNLKEDAYFKMEYVRMDKKYSWVFYATVESDFYYSNDTVAYLGAKKSAFSVNIREDNRPPISMPGFDANSKLDIYRKLYVLSDTYISDELLHKSVFMNIGTRTARGYKTEYGSKDQKGRFRKTKELYRLIKAGSVIIYKEENKKELLDLFDNKDMKIIGCNEYMIGGEK